VAPGRSAAVVFTLRGPRRAARLRVDATWSGPGGSGRALRTFATGSARVRGR
jgi:hypothetical protein